MRRPTIKDVARQSGFSLSTVSLVINKRGYVSPETRQRVMDVVERLQYHPTRSARGLASKTSGNIGFILTEDHFSQAEPFYTRIFLGTEFEARTHHFYILLTTVGNEYSQSDVPRFLLERNVDGVIIAGKINPKVIEHVESFGIPCVLVDYQLKRKPLSCVVTDNRGGARLAVSHLLDIGRKQIAFIGGDLSHPSITERYEGYRETLADRGVGVEESLIAADAPEPRVQDGFAAMEKLWERHAAIDGVFAANDAMAIGCMQFLKQKGVRIPDDVALVGFDDIDTCLVTEPTLTSIRVMKEEMGKLAVQRLVEMINAKSRHTVKTTVPVDLIVRGSTVPHAHTAGAAQPARVPAVRA